MSDKDPFRVRNPGYLSMYLLDYLVGQALTGLLANPNNKETLQRNAEIAFEQAEAVIELREQRLEKQKIKQNEPST